MTIINVDLYFNYDLVEDNTPEKNVSKKISHNQKDFPDACIGWSL